MNTKELKKKKIFPILLGCDKNRVDLEHILYKIHEYGINQTDDANDADIVLVQTCAFILPARQEAIENIFYAISLKKNNPDIKIIVSGCFPEKNLVELKDEFPEVDYFLLIKYYSNIISIIENLYGISNSEVCNEIGYKRLISTPSHYAYLKIADGCNNCCAYCTIPRIRGRYRSIPMQTLLKEVDYLTDNGAKEIILVAQDITRYGEDLYKGQRKLIELCKNIIKNKKVQWIRLLYCYPECVDDELLDFIYSQPKMCKYIDIPLQHCDDSILHAMNRRIYEKETNDLMFKIKTQYPNITIRSTFIVGFPGETKKAFNKLKAFLTKYQLDNVGFFPYYREENTKSFFMRKQIPSFIKKIRLKKVQKLQTEINYKNSEKYIGKIYSCLIDNFNENNGCYEGRIEHFAPDVDFIVSIKDSNLIIGEFYKVKIICYNDFEYKGEVVYEYTK